MSPEGFVRNGGILLGGCRDGARGQRLVLEREPGLEASGAVGEPSHWRCPTPLGRARLQFLHQVTSVAKTLHCEQHRGLIPPGTAPGHHPGRLLSLLFPVSQRAPGMTHFQGAGAEGPLTPHTHHGVTPFLGS